MNASCIVETRNLYKRYGALVAVQDANLKVERGQVVGLIGPNGAGKTTLLRMLTTLLPPTSGEVQLLGLEARSPYEAVRRQIGYMPDFFNLYDGLTLDECVRFFGRCYGVEAARLESQVAKALDYVDLGEKRFEQIQHLSRGMTQRLGIANVLVHDPPLIILDEPASGLDPEARIRLRDVLKNLARDGKTIIISSHILSELEELCSHVCVMHKSRIIAQGSIAEIRQSLSSSGLRIRVLSDIERAAQVARELSGVASVSVNQGDLLLQIAGGAQAHAGVNRALIEAGVGVCGLTEETMGLEDLFLEIFEKASRS
jgi:ABC-2 type transport system ATP-binding protein